MRFAAKSDIGKIREINEDSFKVIIGQTGRPDTFIIADGMGGHNAGEVASQTAVDFAEEYIMNYSHIFSDKEKILSGIEKLIEEANKDVYNKAREIDTNHGMGTTFIIAVLFEGVLYIGHVGDSRLYLIRDGKIEKITTDHSYIEELVKNGTITREEALNHPKRNIITRALGCEEDIVVDKISIDIEDMDILMLCTDGLTNMLSENEIVDVINNSDDLQSCCDRLINMSNEKGGDDNITIILVEV